MVCKLCEKNEVEGWFFNTTWCASCRKIKHYLNLYGDRVYEVLDSVLSRSQEKQDNKIDVEIKREIQNKSYALRSTRKKKSDDRTDYDTPK